jgi:hypothetical protein
MERMSKIAGINLTTDKSTDTPETIEGLFKEATDEGFHTRVRANDTANRVMEAHLRGERPSLSPLEIAGLGVRMTQVELKRRRLVQELRSKTITPEQKTAYNAELEELKLELGTLADAKIIGGGNASMTLNAIRKAFPELGPTGASMAKKWEMLKKQYADAGKTVPPEMDDAVKASFKALDKANEDFEAGIMNQRGKKNDLLVKEMKKESRPSTAEEKIANIKSILDANDGCDL